MEDRLLLSTIPAVGTKSPFYGPYGFPVERPNTPVLPYGASSKVATFIDPSANIVHGAHVIVSFKSYIGPFAKLDASTGFIKIGNGSDVLDNATIVANPTGHKPVTTSVVIGDNVSIGFGATVLGPSTIGGSNFGTISSAATSIGPNAVIDGATIAPGAIVGALARVGPGVTVPSGFRGLPGANVTTNDQASNPALGMVVPITPTDLPAVGASLTAYQALAAGYTQLYQGIAATGASPGVTTTGINNGSLATVQGANYEPGTTNGGPSTEPTGIVLPTFLAPMGQQQPGQLNNYPARVTGAVNFHGRAHSFARHLGHHTSIRGDQGQPIEFLNLPGNTPQLQTGNGVTIASPGGGSLAIEQGFQAGRGAVILSGPGTKAIFGPNVSIGAGAVVSSSTLGANTVIGSRAYVLNSNLPSGTVIPPNAIVNNGVITGFVQT